MFLPNQSYESLPTGTIQTHRPCRMRPLRTLHLTSTTSTSTESRLSTLLLLTSYPRGHRPVPSRVFLRGAWRAVGGTALVGVLWHCGCLPQLVDGPGLLDCHQCLSYLDAALTGGHLGAVALVDADGVHWRLAAWSLDMPAPRLQFTTSHRSAQLSVH